MFIRHIPYTLDDLVYTVYDLLHHLLFMWPYGRDRGESFGAFSFSSGARAGGSSGGFGTGSSGGGLTAGSSDGLRQLPKGIV